MRRREDIQPITALKSRSAALVKRLRESRRPVLITQNGEATAVLLDVETYETLRDATVLLKIIAQSETEIQRGHVVSQQAAFRKARARIRKK